jgi:hypothetical protein
MNPTIQQYFDACEARLLTSPAIVSYQVLRREVTLADGKLRIRLALSDGGSAELFEYVEESSGSVRLLKYSYHWQDTQGTLVRRWDNAPHHPNLPNAPHHVHREHGPAQGVSTIPDLISVVAEIESAMK